MASSETEKISDPRLQNAEKAVNWAGMNYQYLLLTILEIENECKIFRIAHYSRATAIPL